MTKISDYGALAALKDTDILDVSEDTGGGSFATMSITGLALKQFFAVRVAEVSVSAGEAGAGTKAVVFANAFPAATTPVVIAVDNTGVVGIGNTSGETNTGFNIVVSNPGTFKYIAFLPF